MNRGETLVPDRIQSALQRPHSTRERLKTAGLLLGGLATGGAIVATAGPSLRAIDRLTEPDKTPLSGATEIPSNLRVTIEGDKDKDLETNVFRPRRWGLNFRIPYEPIYDYSKNMATAVSFSLAIPGEELITAKIDNGIHIQTQNDAPVVSINDEKYLLFPTPPIQAVRDTEDPGIYFFHDIPELASARYGPFTFEGKEYESPDLPGYLLVSEVPIQALFSKEELTLDEDGMSAPDRLLEHAVILDRYGADTKLITLRLPQSDTGGIYFNKSEQQAGIVENALWYLEESKHSFATAVMYHAMHERLARMLTNHTGGYFPSNVLRAYGQFGELYTKIYKEAVSKASNSNPQNPRGHLENIPVPLEFQLFSPNYYDPQSPIGDTQETGISTSIEEAFARGIDVLFSYGDRFEKAIPDLPDHASGNVRGLYNSLESTLIGLRYSNAKLVQTELNPYQDNIRKALG